MSTSHYEFLAAVAKSSLPAVLIFIFGWSVTTWLQGHGEINFSKPAPLVIGALSSLTFFGVQWLYSNWNSLCGYWSWVAWNDGFRNPDLDDWMVYGKFRWRIQSNNGDVALVDARCKKCGNKTIVRENSKKGKIRFYCSSVCFRQKMIFKGTKDTVFDAILRTLIQKLSEKARAGKKQPQC